MDFADSNDFDRKVYEKSVFSQTFCKIGPKWPEDNYGQGMCPRNEKDRAR